MMLHNHLLGAPHSFASTSNQQGPHSHSVSVLNDASILASSVSHQEEIKREFHTREGVYKQMTQAEYVRPKNHQMSQLQSRDAQNFQAVPVRVSFLSLDSVRNQNDVARDDDMDERWCDKMCFNVARELYIYNYGGPFGAADINNPLDKRLYKGTYPTCHDFNRERLSEKSCSLIIGFSAGQMQLLDPLAKEYQISRLYNEERLIEKTSVTWVQWLPGQDHQFMVSYASGCIYVFHDELPCSPGPPSYQLVKQGEKFSVFTCKNKATRNPLFKWQIGDKPITQFAFTNDGRMLATVSTDGYLRIFNYTQMELHSVMKSYFGALNTLAWSPDGKLIATGGEDDLLTVYNVHEKRVVCRGHGHKSWISHVAFDPFCTVTEQDMAATNGSSAADESTLQAMSSIGVSDVNDVILREQKPSSSAKGPVRRLVTQAGSSIHSGSFASFGTVAQPGVGVCYRIGSVGHDTNLCLWDITEDMLKPANVQRHRNSTIIAPMLGLEIQTSSSGRLDPLCEASPATSSSSEKPKKKKAFHKRGFTLGRLGGNDRRRIDAPSSNANSMAQEESRILGTRICPRMEDIPLIEPLVSKKVSNERLTFLAFRRDAFITACQEGFVCTWARPNRDCKKWMNELQANGTISAGNIGSDYSSFAEFPITNNATSSPVTALNRDRIGERDRDYGNSSTSSAACAVMSGTQGAYSL
ncbi:hypothetical protein WR25_25544 [Diploscapter pachys]|uniref:Uncharacterized protein n=1 Tax=Diploscapter pachys TaxID=2018661 RepID=A0A2A2JG45_9BILA|nr:hypothetical protein WR25_25544 [Diploscapter pachys]